MSKVERNQPCPCGSGKKYKRCCLPKDEAAAIDSALRRQAAAEAARVADVTRAFVGEWSDDGLDEASNHVVDLVHAGKLDDAEVAAKDLLARYPDVVDGLERLAMVYEARGDRRQAADYYRRAVAFIGDSEDYDREMVDFLQRKADELDPSPAQDP